MATITAQQKWMSMSDEEKELDEIFNFGERYSAFVREVVGSFDITCQKNVKSDIDAHFNKLKMCAESQQISADEFFKQLMRGIYSAVRGGNVSLLSDLIMKYFTSYSFDRECRKDFDSQHLFKLACESGDKNMVLFFVPVMPKLDYGFRAACLSNQLQIVEMLLQTIEDRSSKEQMFEILSKTIEQVFVNSETHKKIKKLLLRKIAGLGI